jgi:lysophospholipid acyltransferase (LPLAT)-like uncharacterized protein
MEEARPKTLRAEALSSIVHLLSSLIYITVRVKKIGLEEALRASEQGGVFVAWHGDALVPGHILSKHKLTALTSLSRDGDIQTRILEKMGYDIVRGSTGRGGARAAIELANRLKSGVRISFTPDGPRGPRRVIQNGVVYFAKKAQKPICAIVMRYTTCWNLGTWDKYAIPKPFSKVECEFLAPIYVSASDNLDTVAAELTAKMNAAAPDHIGLMMDKP